MPNKKANKFLYWNSPFYFWLLSFFVGRGHDVFTRTTLFAIVKDLPFCQRCLFGIANNIGDSEIFMIQFSKIMDIPVYLRQWIKERIKNARIREDR